MIKNSENKQKSEAACLKEQLQTVARFKSLTDVELTQLASVSRITRKKEGQFIVRAGNEATHYFVLQKGTIAMYFLKPNGKQFTINTYGKSMLFFVSQALAHTRYSGYLEAVQDVVVIAIPASETQRLIKTNSKFAQSMLQHVINENLYLSEIISGFLIDARARLCRFLFRRALETGKSIHGELQFDLHISKGEIATMLDISPETLSRTFAQLKSENIIELDDTVVTIKNVRELVASSENL